MLVFPAANRVGISLSVVELYIVFRVSGCRVSFVIQWIMGDGMSTGVIAWDLPQVVVEDIQRE